MKVDEIKLLSDYVWFQEGPGVRNTQYTQAGVKLLNVANLVNGKVNLSNTTRYISVEEAYGKYRHFLVDEGDLIIASSGIQVEYFDEKMGFIEKRHLPLCMNTSTIRFKTKNNEILNIRYFMYFLKSTYFKKQLSRQITGSAQLNFGPSHLKKMNILLKSIGEQEEIVNILDKLNCVIEKRKRQLEKLDLLAKSQFIEMFGDPKKGIWNYPAVPIARVSQELFAGGDKPTDNSLTSDELYKFPVYSNGVGKNGLLCYAKGYRVDKEAITISARGVIGYSVIRKPYFTPVVRLLTLVPSEDINIIYLKCYLDFSELKCTGTSQGQLTLPEFKKLCVAMPPLDLQNKFAHFVEQTEKSRLKIKQSLEKLEILKKALMQKYFG